MKTCPAGKIGCGIKKDFSEFAKCKGNKDGYMQYCKPCRSKYKKQQYLIQTDGVVNRRWYSSKSSGYVLSIADYNKILIKQNGKCAICAATQGRKDTSLYVDHDHATGTIRGLLCSKCNTAIGMLLDDISLLDKAKDYLQRFPSQLQFSFMNQMQQSVQPPQMPH